MAEQPANPPTTTTMNAITAVVKATAAVLLLNVLYKVCLEAYEIRLYAIKEFGPVIHEFDPYFNYRATEVSPYIIYVLLCVCV